MKRAIQSIIILCFAIPILFSQTLFAQEAEEADSLFFKFDQDSLQLDLGDTVQLKIELTNEAGELQTTPFFVFSRGRNARRSLTVTPRRSDSTGTLAATIIAHKPGSFRIAAISFSPGNRVRTEIPMLALIGHRVGMGVWYYSALLISSLLAAYQLYLIRHRDPASCFRAFLNNNWIGAAVFTGIAIDYLLRA